MCIKKLRFRAEKKLFNLNNKNVAKHFLDKKNKNYKILSQTFFDIN